MNLLLDYRNGGILKLSEPSFSFMGLRWETALRKVLNFVFETLSTHI